MKYLVHSVCGSASSAPISLASVELFVFSFLLLGHTKYRHHGHGLTDVSAHIIMCLVGCVYPPLYYMQVVRTHYQGKPYCELHILQ